MREHILWYEEDKLYKATYNTYLERIVVKEADTAIIIMIYKNVSSFEWQIFKLRILKWKKKPVQDVEKK